MSLTTSSTAPNLLEDHHKQILQYFLHDGAYNAQELSELLGTVRDRYDLKIKAQDELRTFNESFLPLINKHVNPYGIEIKQVASEEHEKEIYFVCTQNFKAQFVKLDSSYSEREAAVFEKLLELIVTSDEKAITTREVFESILANDLKMTQKEFNETMARFQRDKWIESGPGNTVILHPRAILEMQSFIIDTYRDDIHHCQICRRLLIRGLCCSKSSCDVHLHRSCAGQYFLRLSKSTSSTQSKKAQYPCPACKQEWTKTDVDSILRSSTATNDENDAQPSASAKNKRQRTSRTVNVHPVRQNRSARRVVDDDEDEDGNDGDEN